MWLIIGVVILVLAVIAFKFVGIKRTPPPSFDTSQAFRPAAKIAIGNQKKPVAEKKENQIALKVFYGSQTGTAEDFAATLVEEANSYNFFAEICDIEDYTPEDLEQETFVMFTLATYGEGEPTDSAKEFYEWLMSDERDQTPDMFSNLKFTVFGLGNKTYEHYNAVARKVDERLEQLGGKRIFERGEGDDDSSLQEDFDNWKGKLWEPVCAHFGLDFKSAALNTKPLYTIKELPADTKHSTLVTWNIKGMNKNIIDAKNPMLCKIIVNRELHSAKSDRSCKHIEIELHPKMKYVAGDHVGVFPENDFDEVNQWVKYFNLDPKQLVSVISEEAPMRPLIGPCTIQRILTNFVDIFAPPRKKLLQIIAGLYTSDEQEKQRLELLGSSSEAGWEAYNEYIKNPQRTLLEVLRDFPSCRPPFHHVLELVPHLQPRYYSISSSLKEHPGRVHLTAVLVKYQTETGRTHKGVCTSFLSNKMINHEGQDEHFVPCFIRSSTFRLPKNPSAPIIMIGPGTGIAPFRGFLQERRHVDPEKRGKSILFFGCRSSDIDYLYREELEQHLADGSLSELVVAFSREGNEKVYVQHRLIELKDSIYPLLKDAYIYVCGDAKFMAKDVHRALRQIVMEAGGKTQKEAESFITSLQTTNRYQQDVWT